MDKKTSIGLDDLINKIKAELLKPQVTDDLFFVEEVSLEINFVISGDINSGFNLGVVTLGSDVNEQRTQKITIKLTPIFSKDELRKTFSGEEAKKISDASRDSLFKGDVRTK